MKTKLSLLIVAILALAFTAPLPAQSTNVAPVALTTPPVPRPIESIAPVKLDAAHSAAFLSAIAAVVTMPAGTTPVSGSYRLNADGTITILGQVKPVAPVTTQ